MNLCKYEHEQICYDTYSCPLCDLIRDHSKNIRDLEKEINGLEKQVRQVLEQLERAELESA